MVSGSQDPKASSGVLNGLHWHDDGFRSDSNWSSVRELLQLPPLVGSSSAAGLTELKCLAAYPPLAGSTKPNGAELPDVAKRMLLTVVEPALLRLILTDSSSIQNAKRPSMPSFWGIPTVFLTTLKSASAVLQTGIHSAQMATLFMSHGLGLVRLT